MNLAELKELIQLIDSTGIQKCEIHFDNVTVKTNKRGKTVSSVKTATKTLEAPETPVYTDELASDEPTTIMPKEKEDVIDGNVVTSPIVGTFYASSSPEREPFAPKGKRVRKGDVLCIIEAMKVMNEINSPYDGEIAQVFAENEEMVDFGKPLFRIV